MEFSLFGGFCKKKIYNSWDFYEYLVILRQLRISCYLETILRECEISADLRKIL